MLAGDVATGTRVFDLFAEWPYPVVFVPGNHEFYGSSVHTILGEFLARAAHYPNIKVLSPGLVEEVEFEGVRFLGCTLWTDYEIFGKDLRSKAMRQCELKVIDHQEISETNGLPFTPEIARSLHLSQRKWLAKMLARPFPGKTVVVTHHAPHSNSIHPRFADQATTAAYVSDLTSLLGTAALHIHGHTHDSFDYHVGSTRVICNPMGYCRGIKHARSRYELQRENNEFDPRMVVRI